MSEQELRTLLQVHNDIPANERPMVTVGFNRRFAPMAVELGKFVQNLREPLMITYRVNAGFVPPSHWIQDAEQGAGRIIGEACHFIDFCTYLTGSALRSLQASALPNGGQYRDDNVTITLRFENGSVATITYVANGDKAFPKERVEVFAGGSVAVLDDFRSLELVRGGRKRVVRSRLRQDKGHLGEWQAFAAALRSGAAAPIAFDDLARTTLATLRVAEACASGSAIRTDLGPLLVEANGNSAG